MMTLEERVRRIEQQRQDGPLWFKQAGMYNRRVLPVSDVSCLSATYNATSHLTRVVLTWSDITDPEVLGYNIWISLPSGSLFNVYYIEHAPAVFDLGTAETGVCVASIQTVLKNGQTLALELCPTVTFDVTI